jgi:uncharacterized protein YjbI with pentapeptide repeats
MLVGIAGIEADLKDANLGGARLNEANLSVFRHGLPANYAPDFAKHGKGQVTLSQVWSQGGFPLSPRIVQYVAWGA